MIGLEVGAVEGVILRASQLDGTAVRIDEPLAAEHAVLLVVRAWGARRAGVSRLPLGAACRPCAAP